MDQIRNAHDTHCCIAHGCKYCDPDCPIALGIRRQVYPCEDCETESYHDHGPVRRTDEEQEEYIAALWLEKQNPTNLLSPNELVVAEMATQHGRKRLANLLKCIVDSEIPISEIIEILEKLKHIG